MVVVVDTCSLHRLVEYYLPLDKSGKLIPLLEQEFLSGDMMMTQAVFEECSRISKGVIVKRLPFLVSRQGKKLIIAADKFLPDQKLLRIVNENFTVTQIFKSFPPEQQEAQRANYLAGGDFSILKCAYMQKKGMAGELFGDDLRVLTDESSAENDNKLFKKIPSCCKFLEVPTLNICAYLEIITDGKIELIIKK